MKRNLVLTATAVLLCACAFLCTAWGGNNEPKDNQPQVEEQQQMPEEQAQQDEQQNQEEQAAPEEGQQNPEEQPEG